MNLNDEAKVAARAANAYIKRHPAAEISIHMHTLLRTLRTTGEIGLLLMRYMQHVKKTTGSTHLEVEDVFTEPEAAVLRAAEEEVIRREAG